MGIKQKNSLKDSCNFWTAKTAEMSASEEDAPEKSASTGEKILKVAGGIALAALGGYAATKLLKSTGTGGSGTGTRTTARGFTGWWQKQSDSQLLENLDGLLDKQRTGVFSTRDSQNYQEALAEWSRRGQQGGMKHYKMWMRRKNVGF